MTRVATALVVAIAVVAVSAGCGRRVVMDPDEVHRHNTDWVLRRPSPAAAPAGAPGAAPPASDAGTSPGMI